MKTVFDEMGMQNEEEFTMRIIFFEYDYVPLSVKTRESFPS